MGDKMRVETILNIMIEKLDWSKLNLLFIKEENTGIEENIDDNWKIRYNFGVRGEYIV